MSTKKRVMVIDDEKDFLMITKMNLEETGRYDVMTLSSGKNVIDEIHKFKPDIILLDMLMPSIGGLEICALLNEDPIGKDIPVIIISALEKDKDKLSAYKQGIVDYAIKPIEKDDIIARIEKALKFK
ncbi:MAG: response regulator [Candidatus Omnitrophota bacterium]